MVSAAFFEGSKSGCFSCKRFTRSDFRYVTGAAAPSAAATVVLAGAAGADDVLEVLDIFEVDFAFDDEAFEEGSLLALRLVSSVENDKRCERLAIGKHVVAVGWTNAASQADCEATTPITNKQHKKCIDSRGGMMYVEGIERFL